MDHVKAKDRQIAARHNISCSSEGSLVISGFPLCMGADMFCMLAYGNRYHRFGIAEGSMLICSKKIKPIQDQDLVMVLDDGVPTLYIYRKNANISTMGEMRVLHDVNRISARVIASFNFYR